MVWENLDHIFLFEISFCCCFCCPYQHHLVWIWHFSSFLSHSWVFKWSSYSKFLGPCSFSHSLTVECLLSHALNFYISYPFCSLLNTLGLYLPLPIECFLWIRHLNPVHQTSFMTPLSSSMIACLLYLGTTWKIFSQAWLRGKSCHFFFHMFYASFTSISTCKVWAGGYLSCDRVTRCSLLSSIPMSSSNIFLLSWNAIPLLQSI